MDRKPTQLQVPPQEEGRAWQAEGRPAFRRRRPHGPRGYISQVLSIVPPWLLVGIWALAVYLWVNVARISALAPDLNVYLVQPLLWLSLGAVSFLGWRFALVERPPARPGLVVTGFLVGAFQVALWLLAALAFGLGASPYGHTPLVILGNLIYVGSMLVSVEMARAFLIAGMARRPTLAIVLASLIFTLLNVPLAQWRMAPDWGAFGRLAGETLLPGFAENMLASFMALLGGPLPAMAYRGVLQAFEWLSPGLPRLPWAATAFVGTLGPSLGLLLVYRTFQGRRSEQRKSLGLTWPLLGMAAVALLWFNVGLFGVQPSVVSGLSMEPSMAPGDVAIVREVPPQEIAVGDVVRYRHEGIHVVHRVVEIQEGPAGRVFVTQGDANDAPDPPLTEDRIEGVVVMVIPKIGWVAIVARRLMGWLF